MRLVTETANRSCRCPGISANAAAGHGVSLRFTEEGLAPPSGGRRGPRECNGLGVAMRRLLCLITALATALTLAALTPPGPANAATTPANVDVSQRHLNESEEAVAVNPTNPNNIVIVTNVGHAEAGLTAGMFEAVSFDGGRTGTRKLIGLGAGD